LIGNRAASEKGFFGQIGTVLDVAKAQVDALYVTAGVIRTWVVLELVYGPDIRYHDDNAT
jgi:hypothetical protein